MVNDKKKLIVIAGPTAVGKTAYSIKLAKEIGGEIISLDSVQVYKYLDIGSAKIKKEEMQGIKHYMIDEYEPSYPLNVCEYKEKVYSYMDKIYANGNIPILVGGTGFYIRAILYDCDFLEEDDKVVGNIRKALYDEFDKYGIDHMAEELKKIDEESYFAIPKQNVRRVIRAIEFYKIHNEKISEHNKKEREKESPFDFIYYVLDMDREKLYDRIDRRVDMMIEEGLLIEIKRLIDMGFTKNMHSMKSIGYSEFYDFVKEHSVIDDVQSLPDDDKAKLLDLIALVKQYSRNYAKRQLTWFRKEKNVTFIKK